VLDAGQRAGTILRDHRRDLERLIALLEKLETLERTDIEDCLGPVTGKSYEEND
jgi:ATP-dependent Zn protease